MMGLCDYYELLQGRGIQLRSTLLDNTRRAGGREALSNRFWFLVNAQYEYNWIRLRQLTYLSEIPKMDQNWDPSAGLFSS